ncbi:hypothetical protein CsatB_015941 [Cannabis sativa]
MGFQFGIMPWIMRLRHLKRIILGLLFHYLKDNMLLVVNGFTKSSLMLMGVLRDLKLGWLPRGTTNKKELITLTRLHQLQSLSLSSLF